jgi:hypothetical protein
VEEQKKMKKILVVLLAILVAGGLFAQISFTGDVKTGLRLSQTGDPASTIGDEKLIELWHDDAAQRFYLEGKLTVADNYGLSFGLVGKPAPDAVAFDYARLYGEFLNDVLRVTVGKGTGGAWGTGGKLDTTFDDTSGLKLEIMPVAGLDVGAQFRTELGTKVSASPLMTLDQWSNEITFGVKYEAAGLFKVVTALKLDSDYGDVEGSPAVEGVYTKDKFVAPVAAVAPSGDEGKDVRALFAVEFSGIKNLSLKAQARIFGLGDLDTLGTAGFGQNLEYTLNALTLGVSAGEYLDIREHETAQDEGTDSTLRLEVEPYVSFKISDPLTASLNIPFSTGWNNDITADGAADTLYKVGVKPKVAYAFNSNVGIETYYLIEVVQNKGIGAGEPNPDSYLTHAVQVNFNWSF